MAETTRYYLLISGPDGERRHPLAPGATAIGRRPDNDIVLAHHFVSGHHARIDCSAAGCTLTDLDSTNGTMLDEETLVAGTAHSLRDGSTIQIGPFSLRLEEVAAEITPEAPPRERPQPVPRVAAVQKEDDTIPFQPAVPPPGLAYHSRNLLDYLPGIYHTDFVSRFLAIFESILTPIEWTVDNFDLFLDPHTVPEAFLPWLANWYTISFDASWSEPQQRALLAAAPSLYARRGTRWALSRVLEIYVGQTPEIVEFENEEEPFTFTVRLPVTRDRVDETLIQRIIDLHKPAHTSYRLHYAGAED